MDLTASLSYTKPMIVAEVKPILQDDGNINLNVVLACRYMRTKNGVSIEEIKYFDTKNIPILQSTNMNRCFNEKDSNSVYSILLIVYEALLNLEYCPYRTPNHKSSGLKRSVEPHCIFIRLCRAAICPRLNTCHGSHDLPYGNRFLIIDD